MAFSYNATSPGNVDKVRLLIGDTNSANYMFEDSELSTLLTMWSSDLNLAAAQALRAVAADQARQAIYYQVSGLAGFMMDRRDVAKNLLAAADALEKRALATPWEYTSTLDHEVGQDGVDRSNYPDTEA